MSKFMLSVGLMLASLTGFSGGVPGATPEAKPLLTVLANAPQDGPFYTYADALADKHDREDQGYHAEIVYDDSGEFWWVYCS